MKQKKLIIFMPSIEGGGVEKNLFLVSNHLSKKFSKISLITASKKYKKKFNNKIKFISPKYNIWDKFSRRTKYLISLLLLFREYIKFPNLIVFSFQANIYCILLCKILKIKIIVRSNSSPDGWSKNLVKNYLYKSILQKSDKIMVNSLEFKKQLKLKFNVNAVCIYNPLNLKEVISQSKKKNKKIYSNNDNLKIINIGRYTEQKDQITLLKALKFIEKKIKYEAVIVGRGILKSKLEDFIKNNQLKNNIKLLNFTKNPFPLIKQADLFILSSTYEGLPNVLLEALALKKFIISSKCPTGPKEILLNGKGGLLFKIKNYKALGKKIIYFKNNKKKCNKMLNYAISKIDRFEYNKNLNKYFNLVKPFIFE